MTRGKAIIEARKILGNQGAVQKRGKDLCIGTDDGSGFKMISAGRTWEEALKNHGSSKRKG